MSKSIKPLTAALGAAFLATAVAPAASAANPFAAERLAVGYDLANHQQQPDSKPAEGKCGAKPGEGKCGEGKCGGKGEPGKKAAGEGKCGEGKCGGDKPKAGEGMCGNH